MNFFNDELSGNDTTGGAGLLSKWKQKKAERKVNKANKLLSDYQPPQKDFLTSIMDMIAQYWIWGAVIGGLWLAWKYLFNGKHHSFRRKKKKVNNGRSFYLRMKRAKERKNKK